MHWRTGLIPVFVILAAIGAGCATTSPGPAPTPVVSPTPGVTLTQPATVPVTTPSAATESCIEPGPTVTIPPLYMVAVDVTRNPVTISKQITVTFQGGQGQYLTQRVDVTVTHPDCTSETQSITPPGEPGGGSISAGSSVTFNGTDRDRVQVSVTINGVSYPIIDQIYTQQTHP